LKTLHKSYTFSDIAYKQTAVHYNV